MLAGVRATGGGDEPGVGGPGRRPGQQRTATPAISADGRYVAFGSDASNLVAGDTNGAGDVFVRDRETR